MKRLRLYDMRYGRLPGIVGLCSSDTTRIAQICNAAQRRLLYCREAGDEGWYGTFAEMAFNVSRDLPTITLPRSVARLEFVNGCDNPVAIQNQFYEYLNFGNGRLPKQYPVCSSSLTQCLSRNSVPTFTDLSASNQTVRVYPGDAADKGRRILLQGLDNNGVPIYSQDGTVRVDGIFLVLERPFVDCPIRFNTITGIQKDITAGPVQIFQVDPATNNETLLLTMESSEQTAWYRRYYLDDLPCGCCVSPASTAACPMVQMTAIAKLEPIPVMVDTDYFLIQNEEALIEECQSVRYSEMDTQTAKAMAAERHQQAVRYLNGELTHYLGKDSPAINFVPFGTARLEKQLIGTLV
jgi:hypothetical protein